MKHTVKKLMFVKQALVLAKSQSVSRLMVEDDLLKSLVLSEEIAEISGKINTISRAISIVESIGRDASQTYTILNS